MQLALALAFDLDTDAVTSEVNTPLLTRTELRRLRSRLPNALPAELWNAADDRAASVAAQRA
jgi:hypothetical protein